MLRNPKLELIDNIYGSKKEIKINLGHFINQWSLSKDCCKYVENYKKNKNFAITTHLLVSKKGSSKKPIIDFLNQLKRTVLFIGPKESIIGVRAINCNGPIRNRSNSKMTSAIKWTLFGSRKKWTYSRTRLRQHRLWVWPYRRKLAARWKKKKGVQKTNKWQILLAVLAQLAGSISLSIRSLRVLHPYPALNIMFNSYFY